MTIRTCAWAFTVLLCSTGVNAQAADTSAGLSAGLRSDSFEWNFASDLTGTGTPNILSELEWNGLHIFELGATAETTWPNHLHLRGSASVGWIYDGRSRDSDYLGDNRTLENQRSLHDSSGDNVIDFSIGAGIRVPVTLGHVTPVFGYSQHRQNLELTAGRLIIPPLGSFTSLDSTYRSRWDGPWVGVEWFTEGQYGIDAVMRIEYHRADYYAKANWNLRADFQHPKSFEHIANGDGWVMSIGLSKPLASGWSARAGVDIQRWSTDSGLNRQFLANGAIAASRLNTVEWESRRLSFTMEYPLR